MESTDESSPRSLDLIFNPSVNYFNRFDLWIEKQPLIVSVMATTFSLVFSPLLCIVGMALLSMPARFYMKLFLDVNVVSNSSSQRDSGMYARAETTHRRQWMWLGSQMCRFVMLLVTILVAMNFFVSHLKGLPLLAFPLWKWSLFALTLTSAYLECLMIPVLLYSIFKSRLVRNSLSTQFLYWSLMRNVSLCLYFGLVLLAWMLYFRTELGLKHNILATEARNEAFEYVTWSLISLFVGSILLALGHAYLLRYWFIKRIYGSFEARILFTWIKYLYLALLVDDFVPAGVGVIMSLEHLKPRNASLTHYIISAKTDIGILCKGANVLQRLAKIVRSREEDGLSDVVKWCQDKIARNDDE